ncbi:MAG: maleylpyruvate isomerase family mycothiol-dependent enzyme [Chloroflexi bacterium]|nr:maleylpyruvate isomerase family mycothiol-dependent enzyme [Chloroflexota bacterium]
MDSPEARVKIASAESERLNEYLSSLSAEAWSKPSACDRWEVRDVVAHLVGVAQSYTERTHRSLRGDSSPPEGLPAPGSVNAAVFAEGSAQRVLSRRERLGNRVLSDFSKAKDQLDQLLATLGPQDWDKPSYYVSIGIASMRFRPDVWISELAIHGWDIRSRLEPEAHLSEETVPVLMDVVREQLTKWIFSPGPRLPAPIRYRFELTGVCANSRDILVEGDKASMEPAGTGKADVTLHCDAETFILIAFGRLSTDTAISADRLTTQGDNRLALEFQRWFPGA